MEKTVDQIKIQTAADLVAAIEKLGSSVRSLDEVYLKDGFGGAIEMVLLEQETLSDGSVVHNFILSDGTDPNA